jgi:hypothetical protein
VPGSRVTADPELLRQLYVLDRLSAADIATKLGCSGATILRRLRQLGVDVRPTGPAPYRWAEVVGIDWSPEIALCPWLDGDRRESCPQKKPAVAGSPKIWTRSRRCVAVSG